MIGEDQPRPGTACFQTTFFLSLHSVGKLPLATMPCPVGPRNSGQFSARAAVAGKRQIATTRAGKDRIIRRPPRGPCQALGGLSDRTGVECGSVSRSLPNRGLAFMADIVLINPRFEASFWGMEHALPLLGKRANLPVACLPLLAALTPAEHTVTLMDENVEAIDFARLESADIVGVTGMSVQRRRMREILAELKRRRLFTVVGGPWVSVE